MNSLAILARKNKLPEPVKAKHIYTETERAKARAVLDKVLQNSQGNVLASITALKYKV